jgi:hypothetical protein
MPDTNGQLVRPEPPALNPLALLQAAIERGVNPDQLGKLMDMQERWEAAQAAKQFAAALTAFQAEVPAVMKRKQAGKDDSSFGTYKYASYDDVMQAAAPVLARHGVVVTFATEQDEARLRIVCRVRVGTHVEETPFSVPIPADEGERHPEVRGGPVLRQAVRPVRRPQHRRRRGGQGRGRLFENVTDRELAELRELAAERNINVAAFMKVLKVASDDLADIPRERFAHAVSADEAEAGRPQAPAGGREVSPAPVMLGCIPKDPAARPASPRPTGTLPASRTPGRSRVRATTAAAGCGSARGRRPCSPPAIRILVYCLPCAAALMNRWGGGEVRHLGNPERPGEQP